MFISNDPKTVDIKIFKVKDVFLISDAVVKKNLFFPVTELCFPRLPHPKYMCPSRVEAHELVQECSNEELCTFYAHFVTI